MNKDQVNTEDIEEEIEQDEPYSIYLFGDITDETVETTAVPLLELVNEELPVDLYVSTYGGYPRPALLIADIIDRATAPVNMYLLSEVASAGFLIAVAGYQNEYVRTYAYPSTALMWHAGYVEPPGVVAMHELNNQAHVARADWERLVNHIVSHSKLTHAQVNEECWHTDRWFYPDELVELGIVDEIL